MRSRAAQAWTVRETCVNFVWRYFLICRLSYIRRVMCACVCVYSPFLHCMKVI